MGSIPSLWLSSSTMPPHGFLAFLQRHSLPHSPPRHLLRPSPSGQQQCLSWNCCPISILHLQSPCILVDVHLHPGYVGPWHRLSVSFSLHSDGYRSPSLSNSLKCFPSVPTSCPDVGISTLVQLPNPPGTDWSCSLSSSVSLPSFILPSFAWICVFLSDGQGLRLALSWLLCKIFCMWRCIPDASMERDVLHFHLLLCLVSLGHFLKMWVFSFDISAFYWILSDSHFQLKKVSLWILHKASTVGILESKTQIKTNPWRLHNPISFLLFGEKNQSHTSGQQQCWLAPKPGCISCSSAFFLLYNIAFH